MSFNTETALAFAPGMIFNELDGGGMIIDRNTGEYVEASQILDLFPNPSPATPYSQSLQLS